MAKLEIKINGNLKNFSQKEKKEYKPILITPELDELFKKSNLRWIQSLNVLKPGERIITEFNRKNEPVGIVVDVNGKFVRLMN